MKYIKHFNTIAEYNVYKNSNDFIIPNVSDAEEDPTFVRFTPLISTPNYT